MKGSVMQTTSNNSILVDFYSATNLGDDLLLHALLKRYPNTQFIMLASREERILEMQYDNLKVIELGTSDCRRLGAIGRFARARRLLRERETVLSKQKCLVVIGGSIFIQPSASTIRGLISSVCAVKDRARLYGASMNTFILGANFGPYRSNRFLKGFHDIFSRCNDVCSRDQKSSGLFSDLKNVRFAPDILFATPFLDGPKQKQALLSVIDLKTKGQTESLASYASAYETWIANASHWFAKNGYRVVVSSFCKAEGDENAVERVAEKVNQLGSSIEVLLYRGDAAPVLDEISKSEVVVATRFHAMVLGLASGAKVLSVPYSKKAAYVMADIGFDRGNVLDIASIDPADMTPCERILESEPLCVSTFAKEALRHFRALDDYLLKSPDGNHETALS